MTKEGDYTNYDFEGRISSISKNGRLGIVLLTRKVYGKDFAVINAGTLGRVNLMNMGKLSVGTNVKGLGKLGVDVLIATHVDKI